MRLRHDQYSSIPLRAYLASVDSETTANDGYVRVRAARAPKASDTNGAIPGIDSDVFHRGALGAAPVDTHRAEVSRSDAYIH